MSNITHCDIAIIGAGAGGLSVAAVAAQLGLKVILVEGNTMGGDCLNYGCIPSKSLLAAAKSAHAMLTASKFGISTGQVNIDFPAVMAHVANVIQTLSKHDSVERFKGLGVEVIEAPAKFMDNKSIEAGNRRIQARRFIIACGSSPAIPKIIGLEQVEFFTNETIFKNL